MSLAQEAREIMRVHPEDDPKFPNKPACTNFTAGRRVVEDKRVGNRA